ncbi:hypothetical protein B0I72DRAFT_164274 [Yarrowia lipolytica]|uniref:Secreted protein n=1 Tax=Yarrowia lipolytica TaxID=4952 RepID=A0A371C8X2_YARLL|nr:hypothetical protein B0I71DRAFT_170212 [Yarrowia lipolytica]RDW33166.1 hypothetical protein B0I72DRAFT_164274 [Yarrowia lipolytica]
MHGAVWWVSWQGLCRLLAVCPVLEFAYAAKVELSTRPDSVQVHAAIKTHASSHAIVVQATSDNPQRVDCGYRKPSLRLTGGFQTLIRAVPDSAGGQTNGAGRKLLEPCKRSFGRTARLLNVEYASSMLFPRG